jgi:predicted secreted protein
MTDTVRRVAFVAHCLLNQNAKVSEFARCAGVFSPLVGRLVEHGWEIQQLPCPEMSFLGVSRWWQSREQYDTAGYRRHCRALAKSVVDLAELHIAHAYDIVVIGLDGSPSSGVRLTSTKPEWGGRPEGAIAGGSSRRPGMGVWMEELKTEFEARGHAFPRATGIAMDAQDFDLEAALADLDGFLDAADESTTEGARP